MSNPENHPHWGQDSFDRDRNWYQHLPKDTWEGDEQARYNELRNRALEDPEFDLFEEFMPTNRPKHDIGRYVMRHAVNVPIIKSMPEWQEALMSGEGMIRSEHRQDYDGQSGLYDSELLRIRLTYPLDQDGYPDEHYQLREDKREYELKRRYYGPPRADLDIGNIEMLHSPYDINYRLGNMAVTSVFADMLKEGLYDGTVNPAMYMRLRHWDSQQEEHLLNAVSTRSKHNLRSDMVEASRWRYIPGVNIRIFRDNVVKDKYYIGGRDSHHHWEVTEGVESADVEAHDKAGYRGRATYDSLQYTLPTSRIIELYEKVRTLPFFDQTQAPMMEMQYGDDDKLYFLQYLKTGLSLDASPSFVLPKGKNVVTSYDVRGATDPDGEKVRIYLDPRKFTRRMRNQAFLSDFSMHTYGLEQTAAMSSRVMIMNTMLSFKDNHWSSAPLYRAPVAIGTWNGTGEVSKAFAEVRKNQPRLTVWDEMTQVEYIEAAFTSNGREAVIDSDWQLRSEEIN